MKKFFILTALLLSSTAFAGENLPVCHAQLFDEYNTLVSEAEWQEDLFMGTLEGASVPTLITTSVGNDKVMSLWVREEREEGQAGMFSFVDLSSGKEQFLKFYMADKFAVAVSCIWE
ncbi:MAG: hypothetical protein WC635_11550 [Bacteriovorax sp.]|jgi:hypothetical protein